MKYHIPMLYDEHNLKKQESSEFGSYMGKQDSNINIDVSKIKTSWTIQTNYNTNKHKENEKKQINHNCQAEKKKSNIKNKYWTIK